MSFPSAGLGLDDGQDSIDLQDMDASTRDARNLFPEMELMGSGSFLFKDEKDESNDMLNYEQLDNEDDGRQQGAEIDGGGPQDLSSVVTTDIPAPPISHSNPETPNEPFDFSFGDDIPLMHRVSSEQSLLPSLTSKYQNVQPQARFSSQRLDQPTPLAKVNRAEKHNRSQDKVAIAPYTSAASTVSWVQNNHQAGLDTGIPFEPGARQSHVRTPIRPSSLRNSYPPPSSDFAQSPSETNQNHHQQMRTGVETIALDHSTGFRARRHTDADFRSHQPRMAESNMYNPGHYVPHSIASSAAHFAEQSYYPSPHSQYSQSYGTHPSYIPPHIPPQVHGNIAHGNVNQNWRGNELMLQQPANPFQPQMLPNQPSAYLSQHLTMMKREEPSPDEGTQLLNYRPLKNAEIAVNTEAHGFDQDTDTPRNDEEDKPFFDTIMASMFDISQAEDNEGMILTWRNQLNDHDGISEVAANLLRLCKRRESLGRPFKKGGKPAHQFDTFKGRFDAICQALRTQKTMCKHLMRQSYIEEIIDDPLGAVARITNNRKVNKGKKAAIEEGRLAMNRKAHEKSQRIRRPSMGDDDDELDAEHDSDREDFDQDYALMVSNTSQMGPRLGEKRSRAHHTSSEDTYEREGSAPKRGKRASRSKYQLNEDNIMVDTSVTPLKAGPRLHDSGHAGARDIHFQQSYGGGMGDAADHRSRHASWGPNSNARGSGGYPPTSAYPTSDQHQHDGRPRRHTSHTQR